MPVNSVIATPESDATVRLDDDGTIQVKGYALPSGEGGPVVKVEISSDEGQTWTDADLLGHPDDGKWSWKLWEARIKVEGGHDRSLFSRATDAGGFVQPKSPQWNLRGVCYNGYGEARGFNVV